LGGGTNWFSPSFSPQTNLFYVAARDVPGIYYKGDLEYTAGAQFNGGGFGRVPGQDPSGAIRALDPATGELKWEFKLFSPASSGVLSTAGNLVFGGSNEGDFYALDASTGRLRWRIQMGAGISSNPISYLSAGKQQLAVASGNVIFAFGLEN
jgi:alcohol dehydrogenase (cytochrome c)